jgi:hypothetical protein
LKQFDVPRKKSMGATAPETDLEKLAGDIENEELETRWDLGVDDDEESAADFIISIGVEEELEADVQEVRLVLVKVGLLSH